MRRLSAAVLSGTLMLAAAAPPVLAADDKEPATIRLGLTAFQDMLAIQVGKDQGFYDDAGVDLEIIDLPYDAITEALASGSIDLGAICETTIVTAWDQFPEQRIANMFYTFEGSAIIVRPDSGIATYQELLENGDPDALANAVRQLEGKTVVTTRGTDMEMGVAAALLAGGLTLDDVEIVDMNPDDGLAAFLAGTGDAFLGGLPHRFRLVDEEGMNVLVTAQDLGPEAVIQCGFSTTEDWANENSEALVDFARGTFLTLQYIEENPEEAFPQILDHLNAKTGSTMTYEALDNLWNKIEFFPSTGRAAYDLMVAEDGSRYWKDRLQFVDDYYRAQGVVTNPLNVDDVYLYDETLADYFAKYGEDA